MLLAGIHDQNAPFFETHAHMMHMCLCRHIIFVVIFLNNVMKHSQHTHKLVCIEMYRYCLLDHKNLKQTNLMYTASLLHDDMTHARYYLIKAYGIVSFIGAASVDTKFDWRRADLCLQPGYGRLF